MEEKCRFRPVAVDHDGPLCGRLLFMKALLITAAIACSWQASADSCLHYGEPDATVRGKVHLRTFYGPPGYGETPRIDRRETQAFLFLSSPICVEASGAADEPEEHAQAEITLVPLHGENLKAYQARSISATGRLFHAISGHHHTPVLIEITSVEPRRP